MTPRVRRLLLASALLGLVAGCAHRPAVPVAADTTRRAPVSLASAALRAERVTPPGTPFIRATPTAPLAPQLVVTSQVAHEDLFAHSPTGAGARYIGATHLYRGQQAYVLPFAANYGVAPDRRTDLTYELAIRKPDGSSDGESFSAPLWQGVVFSPGLLLYPSASVAFYAGPDDALGEYRFVVRITDHLTGETRELVHTLVVENYVAPVPPAGFEARTWFDTYYQEPAPEWALPALPLLFTTLPVDQRAAALPPLLGFYDQLLGDNPWLLRPFCTRLAAAAPDEAYILSLVLGHHLRHAVATPAGVDFASWVRLEDFRTHMWPSDADAPLALSTQLDTLWGRFFASGLYAPVDQILGALANHADLGATDRWQRARAALDEPVDLSPEALADANAEEEPDTGAPPPEVRRDVLLRNALWSLRSNARQHPLLRSYLDWTLRVGDLPDAQKKLLQRLLAADAAPSQAQAALHPTPAPGDIR